MRDRQGNDALVEITTLPPSSTKSYWEEKMKQKSPHHSELSVILDLYTGAVSLSQDPGHSWLTNSQFTNPSLCELHTFGVSALLTLCFPGTATLRVHQTHVLPQVSLLSTECHLCQPVWSGATHSCLDTNWRLYGWSEIIYEKRLTHSNALYLVALVAVVVDNIIVRNTCKVLFFSTLRSQQNKYTNIW